MTRLSLKKYIYVAAIVMLLIFFHYIKILNPLESFLNKTFKPFFGVFYSFSSDVNKNYSDETEKIDLTSDLKKAEEKINQLTSENIKLRFLEEENSILRKHLNFLKKDSQHYLMANIISRGELTGGTNQNNQAILIDKGSVDGLYPGLVISSTAIGTSSQGVIIGKVIDVKDHIAEIYLVTNKKIKLAAAIFGDNKTSGIASGDLGLTVKMDFIPQTENIQIGDIVATSGLEQSVSRGLVIGRVSKIIKENNEVWQSAIIEPATDLDSLSIVAVLLP